MRGRAFAGSLAVAAALLFAASSAHAALDQRITLPDGVTQRLTYKIPLDPVTSGQNKIRYKPIAGSGRPAVNGWITGIVPNLVYTDDGTIPSSSKVMFHHGVWTNESNTEKFFASGEEKTQLDLPDGYGYRYLTSEGWGLIEMIHNLTPEPMDLSVTYTVDFIPDSSPAAAGIKRVRPIWMDVVDGRSYPVFDVIKDSGGVDGSFAYPQDAPGKTGLNEQTVPGDGVLLDTTGHVHTGGLSTELFLRRPGASYDGPSCKEPPNRDAEYAALTAAIEKAEADQARIRASLDTGAIRKLKASMKPGKMKKLRKSMKPGEFRKMKRRKTKRLRQLTKSNSKKLAALKSATGARQDNIDLQNRMKSEAAAAQKAYDACTADDPTVKGNRVRLFESTAHYFEPAGPVSWDMAMVSTRDDWKVQVKEGDLLEIQANYETERASWYESMGINIVYWAPGETGGRDPYKTKVDKPGVLNHGHYPENDDHGGGTPTVGPDPKTLGDGILGSGETFAIGGPGNAYAYEAGGFNLPGENGKPPVVRQGESFRFQLSPTDAGKEIWHSLTSCKAPCNKSTGIAYPIADSDFQFDSGQLGTGGPPTVGRTTWSTPANLPVGTHTYFCRIHPLMRGSFRVKPKERGNRE